MSRGKRVVLIGGAILCISSFAVWKLQLRVHGTNRLWQACQKGDAEEVEYLLNSRATANVNDPMVGITPLRIASQQGHADVVKLLLAKGAEIDAVDDRGSTALHYAALFGRPKVVEVLLAKKAKVDAVDAGGATPLHNAAGTGRLEIVRSLLSHGADADARDERGMRPIDEALAVGYVEIGKSVLPDSGVPDVFIASGLGMVERLGELLRTTPRLAIQKRVDGYTPLHVAAVCGQAGAVELLIRHGARVDAETDWGSTPLYMAGCRSVAEALVAKGADLHSGGGRAGTPLSGAARFGRHDVAEYLIEQGADVDAKDSYAAPPLHSAARWGHENLVVLLIKHGADVNARSRSSNATPLHVAEEKGHVKIAEILRKQGARK